MIVKGIIKSIDYQGNTCVVRIPLFETASGDKNVEITATFATLPGIYNGYKENDVVFVGFENNVIDKPIVLGKLYLGADIEGKEARGAINCDNFKAEAPISIPIDSKLVLDNDSKNLTDVNVNNGLSSYNTIADITKNLQKQETQLGSINVKIIDDGENWGAEIQRLTDENVLQNSRINQNAEEITAEVSRASEAEGELDSKLDLTAEAITAEVNKKVPTESGVVERGLSWVLNTERWEVDANDTIDPDTGLPATTLPLMTLDRSGMVIYGNLVLAGYPKTTEIKYARNQNANEHPADNEFTHDTTEGLYAEGYYTWKRTREVFYEYNAETDRWELTKYGLAKYECITGATGSTGEPATTYWTKLSSRFHLGTNQENPIEATPYAKTGGEGERVDTGAYFKYSLDNGATWNSNDWTLITTQTNNKVVIAANSLTAKDLIIKFAHKYTDPGTSQVSYEEYEVESVTYSPLNTPVIDLDNDTDAIKYNPNGTKATGSGSVYSDAQVLLGGSEEPATYTWTCTSGTAVFTTSNSGKTIEVSDVSTAKAILTCSATTTNFKDEFGNYVTVTKDFTVSREVVVASYWLSFPPVHTGNLQQTAIEIKALAKIGNDAEGPDTNAYLRYSWNNGATWAINWTKPVDGVLIIAANTVQNSNLRVQATHDASGTNRQTYEDEIITYSPLNTPIIDLSQDGATLPYDGNSKIGTGNVSSTAEVWLNGQTLSSSSYTVAWAAVSSSCTISQNSNTVTVSAIANNVNTAIARCTITNIINYPGTILTKDFVITKALKGNTGKAASSYWVDVDHDVHTGRLQTEDIEIYAYKQVGFDSTIEVDTEVTLTATAGTFTKTATGHLTILATEINNSTTPITTNITVVATRSGVDYETEIIEYSADTPIISLSNDGGVIKVDKNGTIVVTTSTQPKLYVKGQVITSGINFTWSPVPATASVLSDGTLIVNDITGSSCTFTCSVTYNGETYRKNFNVTKIIDGADGAPGVSPVKLTIENPYDAIPCTSEGVISSSYDYQGQTAHTIRAFEGITPLSFKVASSRPTTDNDDYVITYTIDHVTFTGTARSTASIDPYSAYISALNADQGSVTYTLYKGTDATPLDTVTFEAAKRYAGANSLKVTIENDFDSIPCNSAGTPVSTYDWLRKTTHGVQAYDGTNTVAFDLITSGTPSSSGYVVKQILDGISSVTAHATDAEYKPSIKDSNNKYTKYYANIPNAAALTTDVGTVTYELYKNGALVYSALFTATKMKQGENAVDPDVFVSTGSIKVAKNNGGRTPNLTSGLTVEFVQTVGQDAAEPINGAYYKVYADNTLITYGTGNDGLRQLASTTNSFNLNTIESAADTYIMNTAVSNIIVELCDSNGNKLESETIDVVADGDDLIDYYIIADADAVVIDPNNNNSKTPSSINFTFYRQVGNETPQKLVSSLSSGFTYTVTLNGGSEGTGTNIPADGEWSYNTSSITSGAIIKLYQGTTLWDTAAVKVITEGRNGSTGYSTATVMLYNRSTTAITTSPISTTLYYKFSTQKLYTNSACTTEYTLPTGWYYKIADTANSGDLYCIAAIAYAASTAAEIPASDWAGPVLYVENGRSTTRLSIKNSFDAVPCDYYGDPGSYAFATESIHSLLVYEGTSTQNFKVLSALPSNTAGYIVVYTDNHVIATAGSGETRDRNTASSTEYQWRITGFATYSDGTATYTYDKGDITYTLYKDGTRVDAVKFEAEKVKAGKEGDPAVDYNIKFNEDSIKVYKNSSRAPSSITASFYQTVGSTENDYSGLPKVYIDGTELTSAQYNTANINPNTATTSITFNPTIDPFNTATRSVRVEFGPSTGTWHQLDGEDIEVVIDGTDGTSVATAQLFKRSSTDVTTKPVSTSTDYWNYYFTDSGSSIHAGDIILIGTDAVWNGCTSSIPSGTDPVYETHAAVITTADNNYVKVTNWSTPALYIKNGEDAPVVTDITTYYKLTATTVAKADLVDQAISGTNWQTVWSTDPNTLVPLTDAHSCWTKVVYIYDNGATNIDISKDAAYALAQGKSTNYYGSSDPAGTPGSATYGDTIKKGDCWFVTPTGTTSGYWADGTPANVRDYIGNYYKVGSNYYKIVNATEDDGGVYITYVDSNDVEHTTGSLTTKPTQYKTNILLEWDGSNWKDVEGETVTNKLTANYINALNITAKKITVLENNNATESSSNYKLFEADGLNSSGSVYIAGWNVNRSSLYNDPAEAGQPGGDYSVWLSTGTAATQSIGGSDENKDNWVLTASDNFGLDTAGNIFATGATLNASVFKSTTNLADNTKNYPTNLLSRLEGASKENKEVELKSGGALPRKKDINITIDVGWRNTGGTQFGSDGVGFGPVEDIARGIYSSANFQVAITLEDYAPADIKVPLQLVCTSINNASIGTTTPVIEPDQGFGMGFYYDVPLGAFSYAETMPTNCWTNSDVGWSCDCDVIIKKDSLGTIVNVCELAYSSSIIAMATLRTGTIYVKKDNTWVSTSTTATSWEEIPGTTDDIGGKFFARLPLQQIPDLLISGNVLPDYSWVPITEEETTGEHLTVIKQYVRQSLKETSIGDADLPWTYGYFNYLQSTSGVKTTNLETLWLDDDAPPQIGSREHPFDKIYVRNIYYLSGGLHACSEFNGGTADSWTDSKIASVNFERQGKPTSYGMAWDYDFSNVVTAEQPISTGRKGGDTPTNPVQINTGYNKLAVKVTSSSPIYSYYCCPLTAKSDKKLVVTVSTLTNGGWMETWSQYMVTGTPTTSTGWVDSWHASPKFTLDTNTGGNIWIKIGGIKQNDWNLDFRDIAININCIYIDASSGGTSGGGGGGGTGGGGSIGGGCFEAGTKVMMADKTEKNIEEIQAGDEILSYDINTKLLEPKQVLDAYEIKQRINLVRLYFSDGTVLDTTINHPFYTTDGWVSLMPNYDYDDTYEDLQNQLVEMMQVGQLFYILTNDELKTIRLLKIKYRHGYKEGHYVYNLKIENFNTFFTNGILGHNAKTPNQFVQNIVN